MASVLGEERDLRQSLDELDEAATATAAELSSRREEDLAGLLGRLQGLVERSRGLGGVLRERSGAVAQALDAAADQDVVSTLEAEGAQLADELALAVRDAESLGPDLSALARHDAVVDADELALREQWGDGSEVRAAEEAHRTARGRVELLGRAVEQASSALTGAAGRAEALSRRAEVLATSADDLTSRAAGVESERPGIEVALAEADAHVVDAQDRAEAAERGAAEAEGARHRTAARAEALARALQELHGAGGGEVLRGVDGVVGTLVDVVEIDPGWEAAFEAAAGGSAAAVVVQGRTAAREALGRLRGRGVTGAILAARRDRSVTPWAGTSTSIRVPGGSDQDWGRNGTLPIGAHIESLRPHVRARATSASAQADVEIVLDALVGAAVRVDDWERAIDLALERPDLVVVTAEGDRFAASGWRVRSGQAMVTAAALEEAEQRALDAADLADRATDGLALARGVFDAARRAALDAARALDRHASALNALGADRRRTEAERDRALADLTEARNEQAAAVARFEDEAGALAEAEAALPALTDAMDLAGARAQEAIAGARDLEARRARLAQQRHELQLRHAELTERRRVLEQRLAEVERRLVGHADEREQAAARRRRLQADARALVRLEPLVAAERLRLEDALASLRRDYRSQVEAVRASGERLEALRRERSSAERRLSELRDRIRSLELTVAEADVRTGALAESVRRELGCEPDETLGAPAPDLPEGVGAAEHADAIAQRLASLGPVNPLALDELSVLEVRQRELDEQVDDVRAARRELQGVVRALDEEIMASFAAAAADVNEHFSTLVATLFPGGTGRLVLTEPDDLLNTGVEVEVRPAGRNVRRVSLLSGGERSLAALAFLFAVFRSRPSPFYFMDEVEAALDDVNLSRFLGLLHEFSDEAQLIVVSHQKRTMETADALYGVTMAPGGSSQVVSQRVDRRPLAATN